jgi:hypothetical protein
MSDKFEVGDIVWYVSEEPTCAIKCRFTGYIAGMHRLRNCYNSVEFECRAKYVWVDGEGALEHVKSLLETGLETLYDEQDNLTISIYDAVEALRWVDEIIAEESVDGLDKP